MPALGAAVLMLFTIYVLFVTRINDNAGFECIVTFFFGSRVWTWKLQAVTQFDDRGCGQ